MKQQGKSKSNFHTFISWCWYLLINGVVIYLVIEAFSESFILGIIFAIIGCLLLTKIKSPMQAEQSIEKKLDEVMKEDSPPPTNRTYSKDGIPELNNLIGLATVKQEVTELANFINIQNVRKQKGLKLTPLSYHCVFTGNPGTGKTTVARILAGIYKDLGVVSTGHLVETDRSGLIGEYVGQTAIKTNSVIDDAIGGVLFIDEAYSLLGGSVADYGKEAVATLLKRMEDDRGEFVVILAGYTKEMKDFINSNPGLQSRFSRYIEFPDYNADELHQIFQKLLTKFDYTITKDADAALRDFFAYQVAHKDANFGNARFVRNVFEHTLQRQAARLANEDDHTRENLSEITKEDLPIEG